MRCLAVLFLSVAIVVGGFAMPAFAQEPSATKRAEQGDTPVSMPKAEGLNSYASDDERALDDGYVVPTFKNLSKLYWALAMFDLADDKAVDNFLLINECDLYRKYYGSDFELESLRAATKESIVKNMASYPVKFEVIIPIGIDRYDMGTERFKLDPRTDFFGAKRLEMAVNEIGRPVCGRGRVASGPINGYPKNFILSLSRPFTLTEIPVKPEVAQLYIEEARKFSAKIPETQNYSNYGRIAFLRLKVTMNQFRGYVPYVNTETMADIFGTIDGFEVYGNREKTFLLYSQKDMAKKVYRKKKAVDEDAAGIAVPDQAAPAVPEVDPAPESNPAQ
jgi:hypothetical protein